MRHSSVITGSAQSKEYLEELAQLANGGDWEAASEFVTQCLPYWMAVTRNLVQSRHQADAEDLVQDAVFKLFEQWKAGAGPDRNTRSYVVVAIRNAYIDKLRSPRSHVQSLTVLESTSVEPSVEEDFSIELRLERDAVLRAFAALTEDHQVVLEEVLVKGLKPGELTGRLKREAPAISNLLSRAKQALRRSLLIEYLSTGNHVCAENAQKLPSRVLDAPELHPGNEPAISHAKACEDCRVKWKGFATVGTLLGIAPLFITAQFTANNGLVPLTNPGHPGVEKGNANQLGSGLVPAAQVASPATRILPKLAEMVASRRVILVGSLIAAVGIATLTMQFILVPGGGVPVTYEGELVDANPSGATFSVELSERPPTSAGSRVLTMVFDAPEAKTFQLEHFTLQLSSGNMITGIPAQLECTEIGQGVDCTFSDEEARPEALVFEFDAAKRGNFTLETAATINGEGAVGRATGEWR